MNKEIRKVCVYIRVSTEEQVEGYSLNAQVNTLRQYADLQGWDITKVYADEGISGKSISGRPQLQQLINDIQLGDLDGVLVWKISRLSRSLYDTLHLLRKFDEYGVKFMSYSENFDTSTPIGRLVLQLMAGIAEMERNTLSDNVKLGMKQKALEGGYNGGILFGYDSIDGSLFINEKEAEIVKIIFREYAQGKGLKAIANKLNKAGFVTKRQKLFSIGGIGAILDNPTYIGKIRWNRMQDWNTKRRKGKNPNPVIADGKHKPIITEEIWCLVQELRANKSFKQRQSNEPFLLNALIRCPVCNQGMVPSISSYTRKDGTKKKHRYYECGNFHNKGTTACHANSIRANEAEEFVFSQIKHFVNDERLFTKKILDIYNNSHVEENMYKNEVHDLEKRQSDLTELQERYFHAFEEKLFPLSLLQNRIKQVVDDKTIVEHRLSELKSKLSQTSKKSVPPELIKDLLLKFVSVYEISSREQKKRLLQLLVKRIGVVKLGKRQRTVKSIELEFDFQDPHKSKSVVLIHYLFGEENGIEFASASKNEKNLPLYFQHFLPLFMIRFILHNSKCTINLLY